MPLVCSGRESYRLPSLAARANPRARPVAAVGRHLGTAPRSRIIAVRTLRTGGESPSFFGTHLFPGALAWTSGCRDVRGPVRPGEGAPLQAEGRGLEAGSAQLLAMGLLTIIKKVKKKEKEMRILMV